jgi:hypothetical protein
MRIPGRYNPEDRIPSSHRYEDQAKGVKLGEKVVALFYKYNDLAS